MPAITHSDIELVFRDQYGRAVAVLARVFGDLDLAEEAVQDAFTTAVERWPESGIPPAPQPAPPPRPRLPCRVYRSVA